VLRSVAMVDAERLLADLAPCGNPRRPVRVAVTHPIRDAPLAGTYPRGSVQERERTVVLVVPHADVAVALPIDGSSRPTLGADAALCSAGRGSLVGDQEALRPGPMRTLRVQPRRQHDRRVPGMPANPQHRIGMMPTLSSLGGRE
jgi:hypothetical protein